MIICPYCGHHNREGLLYCEECAHGLSSARVEATLPTRKLEDSMSEFSARTTWGTASIGETSTVIVHIRDASEPLLIKLSDKVLLGRVDKRSSRQPDIDLTPYGALEKGVSRIHAAIDRSDSVLTLIDLGSSNGTHLNGQKLASEQPRVLRDGDEIRLGKLIAHIYFK